MRSVVEYAIPAWIFRGINHIHLFQALQYQCLRSICGAFNHSSSDALEVITGIQPIDLRFQDLSMREWARLRSLDFSHPLFSLMELQDSLFTPLGYLSHLCRSFSGYLDSNNLQIMQRSVIPPAAIHRQRNLTLVNIFEGIDIGKSGDRSDACKSRAQARMTSFVEAFIGHAALVFCDGSSSNGKCGSAAVAVSPVYEFSRNVVSVGDNVEAEVDAILLALEALLLSCRQFPSLRHGIIISDCEAALFIVCAQSDITRWGKYFYQDLGHS